MTPFELVEPATLKEAIAAIDPDDPTVRPIAGGTALMLMMKAGVFQPRRLVSLRKIDGGMSGISRSAMASCSIGALTPLSVVEHSPEVARHAPVIPRIMPRLSNVRVRNVATVGGALAHGDPHMDLPPVVIALGARVRIVGAEGERELRGRGPAHRLLRDRARAQRIDRRRCTSRRRAEAAPPIEGHRRLGRRLAGARRRGGARSRRRHDQVRRASW